MSSELADKRAAEEGFRRVGIGEVKKREWFSLLEKEGAGTPWLKEHDVRPAVPDAAKDAAGSGCTECGAPLPAWRRTKCSDACKKRADNRRKPRTLAALKHRRKSHTEFMKKWRVDKADRVQVIQRRSNEKRNARRKERARATFYTCIECGDRWSRDRIVRPPPKRCDACAHSWERHQSYCSKRRQAIDKKNGRSTQPIALAVGDAATWSCRYALRATGEVTGTVVAVIAPGESPQAALRALGFTKRWDPRVRFGLHKLRPARPLPHVNYLVKVEGKVYRPKANWLRRAQESITPPPAPAPVTRSLNRAGTVKVRTRRD